MSRSAAIILSAISFFALVVLALALFPIANNGMCGIACAFAWLLACGAYRLTKSQSTAGWLTLLTCAMLLSVGVVINTYAATTMINAAADAPVLHNFDMDQYWNEAESWSGNNVMYYMLRFRLGYGVLIALIWKLIGSVTIFYPLLVNALFTLLAIILSGVTTRMVLSGRCGWSDDKLQTAGMIFTAAVAYFLFSGTLLLREASASLAVSLLALGAAQCLRQPWGKGVITFLVGATIIAAIRPSWLFLPCIGAVIIAGRSSSSRSVALLLLIVVVAQWTALDYCFRELGNVEFYSSSEAFPAENFLHDSPGREVYNHTLGQRYFDASLIGKLVMLPLAAIIQYLTPLPWNFGATATLPTEFLLKFTYPWYIVGALVIYYLISTIYKSWRQRSWDVAGGTSANRLAAWGLICWMGTVFIAGGSVARYGVPLLPLVVPAAVWTMAEWRHLRHTRIYSIAYLGLLVIALGAAKFTQSYLTT